MLRLLFSLVLAAFFAFPPASSDACEFLLDGDSGPQPARLEDLPPGIFFGALSCGAKRRVTQVWTLDVDPGKAELGVRDGKLFDTKYTGPLTQLASVQIEDHVRVSVHERTETVSMPRSPIPADRHSFRRFVTFCAISGSADSLDCSLGAMRVKARATARDTDRDGYLDISLYEISVYDGDSKLHVMSFVTPYAASLTADMGTWIEAINAVSDVLTQRELASAD